MLLPIPLRELLQLELPIHVFLLKVLAHHSLNFRIQGPGRGGCGRRGSLGTGFLDRRDPRLHLHALDVGCQIVFIQPGQPERGKGIRLIGGRDAFLVFESLQLRPGLLQVGFGLRQFLFEPGHGLVDHLPPLVQVVGHVLLGDGVGETRDPIRGALPLHGNLDHLGILGGEDLLRQLEALRQNRGSALQLRRGNRSVETLVDEPLHRPLQERPAREDGRLRLEVVPLAEPVLGNGIEVEEPGRFPPSQNARPGLVDLRLQGGADGHKRRKDERESEDQPFPSEDDLEVLSDVEFVFLRDCFIHPGPSQMRDSGLRQEPSPRRTTQRVLARIFRSNLIERMRTYSMSRRIQS